MSTPEAREKWRQTQLKVQAIESEYSGLIDSKVVQLVSHGGQLYCLCSDGKLFVWDGEDPGQFNVEGWRWLDSPSDQYTRECGRRLRELAKKEAKDGKASPG